LAESPPLPKARQAAPLEASGGGAFALHAVELWSRRDDDLVAGELGYTLGRTYTSLSGFCSPDDSRWRHFGTLQMVRLAEWLRDGDFAFWNLGHPHMEYKQAIGARWVQREHFLGRWRQAIEEAPTVPLAARKTAGAPEETDGPGARRPCG
jgi:Leu/Phe-tRNA-protein transferase